MMGCGVFSLCDEVGGEMDEAAKILRCVRWYPVCAVFVSSNWMTGMLSTESVRNGHAIRTWGRRDARRDGQRDERRDGEETGRQAGRRTGRKSHIRAMERMCMNSDSIDFLIEYIYIKL